MKLAEPLVVFAFRKENVRILAELKRYVEAQPKQRNFETVGTRKRRIIICLAIQRRNRMAEPSPTFAFLRGRINTQGAVMPSFTGFACQKPGNMAR